VVVQGCAGTVPAAQELQVVHGARPVAEKLVPFTQGTGEQVELVAFQR